MKLPQLKSRVNDCPVTSVILGDQQPGLKSHQPKTGEPYECGQQGLYGGLHVCPCHISGGEVINLGAALASQWQQQWQRAGSVPDRAHRQLATRPPDHTSLQTFY